MSIEGMGSIASSTPNGQLLPIMLENRAKSDPNGIWAKFPISATSYCAGFRSATNLEVSNATNHVAWLLDGHFGRSTDFETLTYIGTGDLRYTIVLLAAIKVGFKLFLPSPRNSKAAHISLLSRLCCKGLVTTSPEPPCVPLIQEDYDTKKLQIPSLEQLLDSRHTQNYVYQKTFDEAKDDPIFVLHTSGSTGIPKPLIYTHSFAARIANATSLPAPEKFRSLDPLLQKGAFFLMLPPFHVAGLGFSLIIPAFYSSVPVYPLTGIPPTLKGFIDALNYTEMDWAFLAPVLVDELSKDEVSFDIVVSKLKYLFYTGGSVPESSGDVVSSRIPLYQVMGSSECATLPLLQSKNDQSSQDWNYIQVHPFVQPEFRHRFDDLHELVLHRTSDSEKHQPVFLHFPDLAEYETRDLFSPHPTKPGLWKHRGRIDDILVFLNGEKTNPISFEHHITGHPEVRSALIGGQHRFEPSLLVELNDSRPLSPLDQAGVIERIWPTVQEANKQSPAYAKVSKSKILLVDPSTPMLRAGKGTVQRQATLDLYSKKLDQLYMDTDNNSFDTELQRLDLSSQESVTRFVREVVLSVTEWENLGDEDEFFSLGMDSLQVLRIRQELYSAFKLPSITTSTVYANSSVDLLVQELIKYTSKDHQAADSVETRLNTIAATLQKYEYIIDSLVNTEASPAVQKGKASLTSQVIVLTGSTGNVGSHILEKLLGDESVAHIYCLNRAKTSDSIQITRNAERRLPSDFPSSRITFFTTDLSKADLGLDKSSYDTILSSVTQIIHNAWPVDFNKTLKSFEPNLDGVINLITLAVKADRSPSTFFLSSISSVANYHNTLDFKPLVPEAIVTDYSSPASMGYGESKYIAERILDYAVQRLNLNIGAARIGQVAGTANDPRGWNRNEWFPSLVLSSAFIGALPESLGSYGSVTDEIDLVPVDQLADILVELAFTLNQASKGSFMRVFNTAHSRPSTWKTFLPAVQKTLTESLSLQHEGATAADIKILPFKTWVDQLQKSVVKIENGSLAVTPEIVKANPGIKLLDFYESLLTEDQERTIRMEIKHTVQDSKTLRNLEPIKVDWVIGWVNDWLL